MANPTPRRPSEADVLRSVAQHGSVSKAAEALGIGRSTAYKLVAQAKQSRSAEPAPELMRGVKARRKARAGAEEVGAQEQAKPIAGGTIKSHMACIRTLPGRRFVLTSAQNNTVVHAGF